MDAAAARRALGRGRLVGAITLPAGFEAAVRRGETVPLEVQVDNLNEDLLFDLQRALPSAVLGFGHAVGLPGLRATIRERDLLPHDIPFLKYLAVSALALVAFVIAAALAALAVAREWEHKTLKLLRLSPASLGAVLAGKLAASGAVAAVAVLGAAAVVMARLRRGAGLAARRHRPPRRVRRALLVARRVDRRALPPHAADRAARLRPGDAAVHRLRRARADALRRRDASGRIAHLSPLYYAVGVLEWAFFGVRVTPEPIAVDVACSSC